jgi:hypothetical protein
MNKYRVEYTNWSSSLFSENRFSVIIKEENRTETIQKVQFIKDMFVTLQSMIMIKRID